MGPSGIFAYVDPLLNRYGYLAVFVLVVVESFGIPAPGQTILIAAAVYAGTGHLNIAWVAVTAFVAATGGDNLGYLIGRRGGRRLVHRYGRYVFLTEERLGRVERVFARHGGKLVVVARFVDGLRQLNGLVAGIAEMHWLRFLGYNALGAALWVAVWTVLGRTAGRHLPAIYDAFDDYEGYFFLALGLIVVGLIARHLLHRRHVSHGEQPSPDRGD